MPLFTFTDLKCFGARNEEGKERRGKGRKRKRWRVDSICYLGYKSKTSVTQTDLFDWWVPIYLDGLSAVSKFIFPQVPSSISGYGVAGARLSATTVISYFKTRHGQNLGNLSALHFFCICVPVSTFHGSQL